MSTPSRVAHQAAIQRAKQAETPSNKQRGKDLRRMQNRLHQARMNRLNRDTIIGDYDYWANYRNPQYQKRDEKDVLDEHQVVTGPATALKPMPVRVYQATNIIPRARISKRKMWRAVSVLPSTEEMKKFMKSVAPGLGGQKNRWRGIKFLGSGANGSVGLWTYDGDPNETDIKAGKVVIKESKVRNGFLVDMTGEAKILKYLEDGAGSQHINRMLGPLQKLQPRDPLLNGLDGLYKVGRLFLEYCPLNDLRELIKYRQATNTPFDESTLWKIFECLIDGLTVLEKGNETTQDEDGVITEAEIGRGPPIPGLSARMPWDAIVHFDLKPPNGKSTTVCSLLFAVANGSTFPVLLGDKNASHPNNPVVKIADLGLARHTSHVKHKTYERRKMFRRLGTPGYYPPEQFTWRWDFANWNDTDVAGQWTHKMNTWAVGAIMYEAVTCRALTVNIGCPFKPSFPINGAPSKGLTYACDLFQYNRYSNQLVHTIWECLYEKPAHRPENIDLKRRAVEGYNVAVLKATKNGNEQADLYDDLIIPEGPEIQEADLAPLWNPPPGFPASIVPPSVGNPPVPIQYSWGVMPPARSARRPGDPIPNSHIPKYGPNQDHINVVPRANPNPVIQGGGGGGPGPQGGQHQGGGNQVPQNNNVLPGYDARVFLAQLPPGLNYPQPPLQYDGQSRQEWRRSYDEWARLCVGMAALQRGGLNNFGGQAAAGGGNTQYGGHGYALQPPARAFHVPGPFGLSPDPFGPPNAPVPQAGGLVYAAQGQQLRRPLDNGTAFISRLQGQRNGQYYQTPSRMVPFPPQHPQNSAAYGMQGPSQQQTQPGYVVPRPSNAGYRGVDRNPNPYYYSPTTNQPVIVTPRPENSGYRGVDRPLNPDYYRPSLNQQRQPYNLDQQQCQYQQQQQYQQHYQQQYQQPQPPPPPHRAAPPPPPPRAPHPIFCPERIDRAPIISPSQNRPQANPEFVTRALQKLNVQAGPKKQVEEIQRGKEINDQFREFIERGKRQKIRIDVRKAVEKSASGVLKDLVEEEKKKQEEGGGRNGSGKENRMPKG